MQICMKKLPFSINKSTHAKPQRHSSHLTCRLNANKQTNTVRKIMEIMSLWVNSIHIQLNVHIITVLTKGGQVETWLTWPIAPPLMYILPEISGHHTALSCNWNVWVAIFFSVPSLRTKNNKNIFNKNKGRCRDIKTQKHANKVGRLMYLLFLFSLNGVNIFCRLQK